MSLVSDDKTAENDNIVYPDDSALVKADCWVPSPNFSERRNGARVDLLLMHYTATPTNAYALELLTSKEAGVSSHYLIDGEGRILQLVGERYRAWHAGCSCWAGVEDINSCSIGIEIQNQGAALVRLPAYGRVQMDAVEALTKDIVQRHDIPPCRVLAHSDVAPHRKQDPGAHFNWQRLALVGVGLFVEADVEGGYEAASLDKTGLMEFQDKLSAFGYKLDVTGEMDERTTMVVAAFQRHYRPRLVSSVIDKETLVLMDLLLKELAL